MKNYKQLLAGAMATIMVLGSSVVALADTGGTTGQGSLDIVEEADIFRIVLPTDNTEAFNYILDPTGVINETNAAKYAGATFESGETLFFKNEDGEYRHTSDTLTVTNKSTMDVTVTVDISIADVEGIELTADNNFVSGGDAGAQLYLGYVDDEEYTTATGITGDFTASADIAGADGDYVVKYVSDGDGNGSYVKELDPGANSFDTYNFSLEGACSADGWAGLSENPPAVEVVWTVEDPTHTGPTVKLTAGGLITVSGLTGDKNVLGHTSISLTNGTETAILNNKTATFSAEAGWTAAEGGTCTFQLLNPYAVWNNQSVKVIVTLTDNTTITSNSVTLNL